jgi:hypothetical protein
MRDTGQLRALRVAKFCFDNRDCRPPRGREGCRASGRSDASLACQGPIGVPRIGAGPRYWITVALCLYGIGGQGPECEQHSTLPWSVCTNATVTAMTYAWTITPTNPPLHEATKRNGI